jgi:hypothetical protein
VGLCGGDVFCPLWGRKRNFVHHLQQCHHSVTFGLSDLNSGQSTRCLWWTKWHWDTFFSEYWDSPSVCNIPPMFYNHPLFNTVHVTGRSGWSLGSFEHSSGHSVVIRKHRIIMLEFGPLPHFYVQKTINRAKTKVNLVMRLAEHHARKAKQWW